MWVLRYRGTTRQLQISCVGENCFRYQLYPSSKRQLPHTYYHTKWKQEQSTELWRFFASCEFVSSHSEWGFKSQWIEHVLCRIMARGLQLMHYKELSTPILDQSHLLSGCRHLRVTENFLFDVWQCQRADMLRIYLICGRMRIQVFTDVTECYELSDGDYLLIPRNATYRGFALSLVVQLCLWENRI